MKRHQTQDLFCLPTSVSCTSIDRHRGRFYLILALVQDLSTDTQENSKAKHCCRAERQRKSLILSDHTHAIKPECALSIWVDMTRLGGTFIIKCSERNFDERVYKTKHVHGSVHKRVNIWTIICDIYINCDSVFMEIFWENVSSQPYCAMSLPVPVPGQNNYKASAGRMQH